MRIGWLVAVGGGMAMLLAAASLDADPGQPQTAAAATAPALPTMKPLTESRYFAPGAARTYSTPVPTPSPTPTPPPDPCHDLIIHISKTTGVSGNCIPPNLQSIPSQYTYVVDDPEMRVRGEVLTALIEMIQAAENEGRYFLVRSAYRDYHFQAYLFDFWVERLGYDEAWRTSAPPGHSEHQLGTAIDFTSASNNYDLDGFETTAEGQWLAANAYRFGFVMSYPPGTEHITSYAYEPWHFRYIGRDHALAMRDSGLTLHDYTAQN